MVSSGEYVGHHSASHNSSKSETIDSHDWFLFCFNSAHFVISFAEESRM